MFTDVSKQFHEGIELHKSGLLEEAACKYSSLLEKTKDLPENHSGETLSAMPVYASYTDKVTTNWNFRIDTKYKKYKAYANFNLASIRFQQYRYDEAIYHYVEGLKFVPENFGAHTDLAKAYEMTGQWNDAIYHINESLKIFPNHTTALRRKRRILEEKRFYESLQKELELKMKNYKPVPDFSRVNAHFTMQSDYEIEEAVCESVESLMKHVYQEINREFDFQPENPVKIILFYDSAYYDRSMSFPRWATGVYDDGSIKILLRTTDRIHLGLMYVLLRHEYVHKVVEELSDSKCPRWFDEGLSEYKARRMFDFERNILQKAIAENQQTPLDKLEDKFMMPKDKIRLTYIQARSIVELIVEELGIIGVRELLSKIGSCEIKSNDAIYRLLEITPEQLQIEWLRAS